MILMKSLVLDKYLMDKMIDYVYKGSKIIVIILKKYLLLCLFKFKSIFLIKLLIIKKNPKFYSVKNVFHHFFRKELLHFHSNNN